MDKRALWSEILVIIGLVLMGCGIRIPDLLFLGIGVVTVGAFIGRSRRRWVILLGPGLVLASAFVPYFFIAINAITGKTEISRLAKYIQYAVLSFAILITAIGATAILMDKRRTAPPSSPGS